MQEQIISTVHYNHLILKPNSSFAKHPLRKSFLIKDSVQKVLYSFINLLRYETVPQSFFVCIFHDINVFEDYRPVILQNSLRLRFV